MDLIDYELNSLIMRKVFLILSCAVLLGSCNMNPSKEARITLLENQVQTVTQEMNLLEQKVKELETTKAELETKIKALEE